MYEMRYAATDRSAMVWHVMAKGATGSTLCGSDLPLPPETPRTAPTEQYCTTCLAVFRTAMEGGRSAPKSLKSG
ncbi:hypothetical protein [Streptomyces bambusae]|uniref:DUF3039 domain-containing protein n=1 Tax=Streptomyces bambusae TaxID=1550616 RepID=A0ABS6Z5G1_9ACTN|nr:hypothetical protein [Streptomyces bambusae]MBW5483013.1 hypothetical protein [Streptomyces bambusae]